MSVAPAPGEAGERAALPPWRNGRLPGICAQPDERREHFFGDCSSRDVLPALEPTDEPPEPFFGDLSPRGLLPAPRPTDGEQHVLPFSKVRAARHVLEVRHPF